MVKLTDYTSYADAQTHYATAALWDLFDGTAESFNIAHECIDRHAQDPDRIAVRVAHADGRDEVLTFSDLSRWSNRFAHWLRAQGVKPGDRVAFMLDPSRAFYVALFGVMKLGAISVPLFTLFGPEGLRLRVNDCNPTILITNAEKAAMAGAADATRVVVADDAFFATLAGYPARFDIHTRGDDLAAFQYTSGTTRELPAAVKHTHRSIVVLALAALYGTGVRPGDQFFCPSSPAWGHGMWHGTLAPLSLGVTTGTFSGKFNAARLLQVLQDYGINNLSAAATHYRMMNASGVADRYRYHINKLSYTGEPIDPTTLTFVENTFHVPVCSMYGTTEVGVILVNYPGAEDFRVKPGSLGKAIPGQRVEIQNAAGEPCAPKQVGDLKLWRRNEWFPTKDLGYVDEDGYFYHSGRADDVIISAGWTMSAVEIENVLMKHPDVSEVAVIGVKDELRGQVVKAFVVSTRAGDDEFIQALQDFTRERLSQHEYPRIISIVEDLPKTPAGKVNRKVLRDRERAIESLET
jgi:acetyl-CoA synthetase